MQRLAEREPDASSTDQGEASQVATWGRLQGEVSAPPIVTNCGDSRDQYVANFYFGTRLFCIGSPRGHPWSPLNRTLEGSPPWRTLRPPGAAVVGLRLLPHKVDEFAQIATSSNPSEHDRERRARPSGSLHGRVLSFLRVTAGPATAAFHCPRTAAQILRSSSAELNLQRTISTSSDPVRGDPTGESTQMSKLRRKWILLGISAPVAGILAWWIGGEARTDEASAQKDIEKLLLEGRPSGQFCAVHGLPLLPDRVRIQYGLMAVDERAYAKYPNARVFVPGGCGIDPNRTLAYVLYCPTCRKRKAQLEETTLKKS